MSLETLRALAKHWGRTADDLVHEKTRSYEARAYADGKAVTLRYCEKQLIEALAALRHEVQS